MPDRRPGDRPVALIIIDGWGCAPPGPSNAISVASTPTMDRLMKVYPWTTVEASGASVGLPAGQIGNSEVGHLNIGAGYPVLQDLPRIDQEIASGAFRQNAALIGAIEAANAAPGARFHLMGLYSHGGVHSHSGHCRALVEMALERGAEQVLIHLFLDGRDVPPRQALEDVEELEAWLAQRSGARIASVMGRFYAMDRDKRWERTEAAYRALIVGEAERAERASDAIRRSYAQDVGDEFVAPTIVGTPEECTIRPGDSVVFYNFRADRARQLTRAFVLGEFDPFERPTLPRPLHFVTFAQYEDGLPVDAVAFPPTLVDVPLARAVSDAGLRQLHVAETEKYAHVTYFLNGGREPPFAHEDRILVPSPKVRTYDLKPEMSAAGVAKEAAKGVRSGYPFVVLNFANPDMVGHTGVMEAAVRAVESVDRAIDTVVTAASAAGGVTVITADHGNAEEMVDPSTGEPKTAHTTNPVPLIVVGAEEVSSLRAGGRLSDVAPTVLELLRLPTPAEMTAESLIERGD